MQQNIKKFGLILAVLILTMFNKISIIKAIKLDWDSAYYYERTVGGVKDYNGTLKRFTIESRVAYCIEPNVPQGTNQYERKQWEVSSLPDAVKKDVFLYAYYGYDYDYASNHATLEYRAATQALIWERIIGNNAHITYSLKKDNVEPVDISKERTEIINLVNRHDVVPSFSGETIEVDLGTSKSIEDKNGVLSEYTIISDSANIARISGNNLVITPTSKDSIKIDFKRKTRYESEYIIYHADDYQDLIVAGEGYPVYFSINIKGKGGKIILEKLDKDTKTNQAQGKATLKGAVYGVYTANDELVMKLTTNKIGQAKSDSELDLGSYYLQEITPSKGYELDPTKYYFEMTDATDKTIKVYEKVIERNYEFIKVLTNGKTEIMTPEVGVEFGIYDLDGNLISKHTTDAEGKFQVKLPYGEYVLKQLTVTDNYEMLDDYYFKVTESGEETKVFSDSPINAYLKVIKIDASNGLNIPLAKIKFKIYDVENKKYVSQVISYPYQKTIEVFETDENGILLTPFPLEAGSYILEEVDEKIPGYTWNKEKIKFTIDKNTDYVKDKKYGKIIEIKFKNEPVKGTIELYKMGTYLDITKEGIKEKNIFLSKVKFGLYAKENIYDGTGKLIYLKDTLIKEFYTDEQGYAKIENLYLGKYYIKELETIDGFVLDEQIYDVELNYKDQYTSTVYERIEIENVGERGKLKFFKIDALTKKPLENVLIEVYTVDDILVYQGYTNKDGLIEIALPLGKYYLKEIKTLDNYILNEEQVFFEIKDNNEVIECTMENNPYIEVQVPDTFITTSPKSYMAIGLFISLIGYEIKKKKSW